MPVTKETATVQEIDEHINDGEEDKGNPFRAAILTIWGVDGAVPADYTELPVKLQYLAYGHEVAPTTKRPHLQAWAYSTKVMRLTAWKKIFPTASIRKMRGTFAENDRYCSKASTLTELGDRPMENGKKRTLRDLCEEVTAGAKIGVPLSTIIMDSEHKDTFVQYNSGIKTLHTYAVTEKLRKVDKAFAPEVIYVHGPPGTGKTRYVHDLDENVYDCPSEDGYKWKDGYAGQDTVLYDNVSPVTMLCPNRFLKEIDRYFIQVPVKGGYIGWRPKRIIITSVLHPDHFATQTKFTLAAEFLRRITKVVNLGPALDFVPPQTSL